jgi:signal transduction histidine kinase
VGRLAAGVAHEIGNPLSVILGFLEIMQDPALPDEERREYVSRMQGEAERMNRIIKNLLTYSRTPSTERQSVDLEAVLRGALDVLGPQKMMRGVDVDVSCADGLPRVVAGRDRLTQVCVNLILNAAEAMVGEGRMAITLARDDEQDEVVVTFEDDGPGIDEKIAHLIFEPFVTTKPESQGTGLGLSVCLSIVQDLGGTLTAGNREQGGACFTLRLPAGKDA